MNPQRNFRNIRGSFNKFLETEFPSINFNFGEKEFDTTNLQKWCQVDYLSRDLRDKSNIIVQLTFFSNDDRFGTQAGELCDTVMDKLYVQEGGMGFKSIPVYDWFTATEKPVIGHLIVNPRAAQKPVIDQYGVTNVAVTVELRFPRL